MCNIEKIQPGQSVSIVIHTTVVSLPEDCGPIVNTAYHNKGASTAEVPVL